MKTENSIFKCLAYILVFWLVSCKTEFIYRNKNSAGLQITPEILADKVSRLQEQIAAARCTRPMFVLINDIGCDEKTNTCISPPTLHALLRNTEFGLEGRFLGTLTEMPHEIVYRVNNSKILDWRKRNLRRLLVIPSPTEHTIFIVVAPESRRKQSSVPLKDASNNEIFAESLKRQLQELAGREGFFLPLERIWIWRHWANLDKKIEQLLSNQFPSFPGEYSGIMNAFWVVRIDCFVEGTRAILRKEDK